MAESIYDPIIGTTYLDSFPIYAAFLIKKAARPKNL